VHTQAFPINLETSVQFWMTKGLLRFCM